MLCSIAYPSTNGGRARPPSRQCKKERKNCNENICIIMLNHIVWNKNHWKSLNMPWNKASEWRLSPVRMLYDILFFHAGKWFPWMKNDDECILRHKTNAALMWMFECGTIYKWGVYLRRVIFLPLLFPQPIREIYSSDEGSPYQFNRNQMIFFAADDVIWEKINMIGGDVKLPSFRYQGKVRG